MPNNFTLLTETQLAATLGISIWTVRRWRKTRGLPYIGTERRFLYRLTAVLNWLQQQEQHRDLLAQ